MSVVLLRSFTLVEVIWTLAFPEATCPRVHVLPVIWPTVVPALRKRTPFVGSTVKASSV